MTERRRGTRLRVWLEIIGAIIAASAVFVAVAQYQYANHKDAQNVLLDAVKAETEARKDGDGRLAQAIDALVQSQQEQTKAVTTLVTEMRFILAKLNLDGG